MDYASAVAQLLLLVTLFGWTATTDAYDNRTQRYPPPSRRSRATGKSVREHSELFGPLPFSIESYYSPTQVIVNRGYPVEIHHVVTQDGYIIELHRIPPKTKGRRAVFLQHGVFESSGTWLVNPSHRSLPCMLANRGYDVWLGNARGNRYSRSHVRLDPDEAEFWDFGWDEIGAFDIPAVINYVLAQTGLKKLIYTCHSMGGAVFFIAMIKYPELNEKIEMMVGLAPLSSFYHTGTPLRVFFPLVDRPLHRYLIRVLGTRPIVDNEGPLRNVIRNFCERTYQQARRCMRILNTFVLRLDLSNLDLNSVPRINSNDMMGTSLKVGAQFAQNANAGQVFQAFDYGWRGNLERYGTITPLQYNLTRVTAPAYIFYGSEDDVVAPEDVEWLLTKLGNLKYAHKIEGYSHMDFIWGVDVKEKLYNPVISLYPPP